MSTTMPEAAINQYRNLSAIKSEVRLSYNVFCIDTPAGNAR